ncbi:hypothetical protein [Archaeoglobus sp.]
MSVRDWPTGYFYLNAFLLIAIVLSIASIIVRISAGYEIYEAIDPFVVGYCIGQSLFLAIFPTIAFAVYKKVRR